MMDDSQVCVTLPGAGERWTVDEKVGIILKTPNTPIITSPLSSARRLIRIQ